jgi:hypothetical protein
LKNILLAGFAAGRPSSCYGAAPCPGGAGFFILTLITCLTGFMH